LSSAGKYTRSEWFGTACCPSNISRLVASLGDYIYATSDNTAWINLFVSSSTIINSGKRKITLKQESNYPWEGDIHISVLPDKPVDYTLKIRIPGWAQNQPVPGDTYQYISSTSDSIQLLVNGKPFLWYNDHGYAVITRKWKKDDRVDLHIPMAVKKVIARNEVTADNNKVALQRGPLVYCIEHADNGGMIKNIMLPAGASVTTRYQPDLLGGVVTLLCEATVVKVVNNGSSVEAVKQNITAIPYFTWANRGEGEMEVWIPMSIKDVEVK
jgi:hypothetical protein